MGDMDVTLYFNERRLAALEEELKELGTTVQQELEGAFDALYRENVPENERVQIEADILMEQQRELDRHEAAREFAVIHLHDEEDDFCFTSEMHTSIPSIARIYRERMRAEVGG